MAFYLWSTGIAGVLILSSVFQKRKRKHPERKRHKAECSPVLFGVWSGSPLHLNDLLLNMQIPGVCFNPESGTSRIILMNIQV